MCDVMAFFRRGREREARRTKTGQDRDRPERAGKGRGDRPQWCLSLFRADYFLFLFLVLGFCLLSTIMASVLSCCTDYLV